MARMSVFFVDFTQKRMIPTLNPAQLPTRNETRSLKSSEKIEIQFEKMGQMRGIEPPYTDTTNQCLNHLATSAIRSVFDNRATNILSRLQECGHVGTFGASQRVSQPEFSPFRGIGSKGGLMR